jgi:3-deoxy-D-manno-octulosonic-acid transferase
LQDASAAICVQDAAALAEALVSLKSADAQHELRRAAQSALHQDTDFDSLLRAITQALDA